jgi:hypothetical protein
MFDRLLKIKSHQASETLQDSSPLITYRLISVGSTDTAASAPRLAGSVAAHLRQRACWVKTEEGCSVVLHDRGRW